MILKPKQIHKHREPVKVYRDGREVCQKTVEGRREYAERLYLMALRQNCVCCICGKPMPFTTDWTFEHSDLRGMGGGRRDDRISISGKPINGAAHSWCNAKKGSRRDLD